MKMKMKNPSTRNLCDKCGDLKPSYYKVCKKCKHATLGQRIRTKIAKWSLMCFLILLLPLWYLMIKIDMDERRQWE
jgi:hypothetical protein